MPLNLNPHRDCPGPHRRVRNIDSRAILVRCEHTGTDDLWPRCNAEHHAMHYGPNVVTPPVQCHNYTHNDSPYCKYHTYRVTPVPWLEPVQ